MKFRSSVAVGIFQQLDSPTWLVATLLDTDWSPGVIFWAIPRMYNADVTWDPLGLKNSDQR